MAKCPKSLKGWDNLVAIMGNNRELAYQVVFENGGEVPPSDSPLITKIKGYKLVTGPEVTEERDSENESTGYYITKEGKKFRRATDYDVGFIKEFNPLNNNKTNKPNEKKVTLSEHEAEKIYEGLDPEDKLINPYSGEKQNKAEYILQLDKMMEHGRVKGLLIHKAIEGILNPEQSQRINMEIQTLLAEFELKYGDSESIQWEWVRHKNKQGEYDTLQAMLEAVGVNTLTSIANPLEFELLRDKIYSEIKVVNEDLGFGGTIDMLVKKPNGKYSIIDWKTGKRFNPTENKGGNLILKYGNQKTREVLENPINRSKLQIMFYALMLKANNPGMKFDKLAVSWIPTAFNAQSRDPNQNIDVKAFLGMIDEFLSDEAAVKEAGLPKNIKEILLKKDANLFNPTHYTESVTEGLVDELIEQDKTPTTLLTEQILELNTLVGKGYASSKSEERKAELRTLTSEERARVIELTKSILTLQAEGAVDMFGETGESINAFVTYLGNFNDINNPMVQEWKRYWDKQQEKIRKKQIELENKFHSLLKPLMDKEHKKAIGIRGNRNISYKRLYGKFYVTAKSEKTSGAIERFLHKDETDPELKAQYQALSTDEKLFIDFVNETFAKFFDKDAYINKDAYKIDGVDYTHLGSYNSNKDASDKFAYENGFFFKVPITNIELKNRFGLLKALKNYIKLNLTYFVEDNMEQEIGNQQFVPIKYLGNKYVNNTELYTKNIEHIFSGGVGSMLEKEHLDSVYSLGAGISSLLAKDDMIDKYKLLKKFVDLRLFGQVQGRKKRLATSRRSFKTVKMFGKRKGSHSPIAVEKIPKVFQSLASMGIMWLKPAQGLGNTAHAAMLTHRDGLKGSITSRLDGFDNDSIDFTYKDILKAEFEYKDLIGDTAMGKIRKNKMLLMARKFDYFGNNYDYGVMDKFTMSENFKYFNRGTFYLFHSVGEEFVSLTTMAAQMMHMKNKTTGKSLWESYEVIEVGPGIFDLKWTGGTRGTIKSIDGVKTEYTDITELTAQEQAKLRRVHERLQGGYRKDEATNLEVYALGSLMLQFKKYLPRLIINLLHSKMSSTDLGYYKQLHDENGNPIYKDRNGEEIPVMEWHARVEEGRLRSLASAFMKISNIRPEKLSDIEKENMAEATMTMMFLGAALMVYFVVFGDADDDDAAKKWWKMYAIDNLSQQYNVFDLAKTITTAGSPVAITQAYKTSLAFSEVLLATTNYAVGNDDKAFTKKGDLRGWNQFKRGVPFVSSITDVMDKVDKTDPEKWHSFYTEANSNIRLK